MSSTSHFRPATPADYERMLAIWLQGQLQSLGIETKANDTYREELIRLFSDSQNLLQVAEYEGLVVGWIGYFKIFSNPMSGAYARQVSTYFDSQYKIPGMVSAFVKYCLQRAKDAGIEHLYAYAIPENEMGNRIPAYYATKKLQIPSSTQGHIPAFNLYIIDLAQLPE